MPRCFQLPCLLQNGNMLQAKTEMLVVACDNYVTDGNNCRGACAVGMVAGKDTCETCEKFVAPKSLGLVEQVRSMSTAIASKVMHREATSEEQSARLNLCKVCPHLEPSAIEGEVGYCKACGCPKSRMSELTSKAKILFSTCPKKIWSGITYENPRPAEPHADGPPASEA